MDTGSYDIKYYDSITPGSQQSAEEVIPLIRNFIDPGSVIDIGCGLGAWLSVWERMGVRDIFGVDSAHVDVHKLLIDPKFFLSADMENPLQLNKRYDLVMSLEVAEHIKAGHAAGYIESLCRLGDVILFSAAVPHQGGINHFNEQYPGYWIKLFSLNNFSPYDCLREIIWNNKKIDTCYRQNMLFFVRNDVQKAYPAIAKENKASLDLVHPELYELKCRNISDYQRILKNPFRANWYLFKKFTRLLISKTGLWK